ncbi:MAG: MoxR family ATPase [Lentisphaerae bacterium]|jgi:MoxR-like ATPase|nr:MoxR family ATPase [Lentisphaerota bacterium]MBT4817227.1 MoxR family ATPase [Lentisphaerota bacterium]MBT5604354.1 MoxR family ATPase [Lentisphaerota bacterium]MBT7053447.1 MoxR family ATPase [Lentisphaerota bacterium]MBT7847465.1 MoxR family ATPase [Lentisphaerota bacterium]
MSDEAKLAQAASAFRADVERIRAAVGEVIVGQGRVVECTVTALIAGGNVLLEGVPGLGKTELVKTLGRVLELEFKRIQFTPDLMPADIIGTKVMATDPTGRYQFEFRHGPVFTQLLLADEINRATPKTQSALLETMQERSVTVDGTTHKLTPPFFVLATQNPIEQEGTYPLPEAQLDRFMFKVSVPFLDRDEMNEVMTRTIVAQSVDVEKVVSGARILEMRDVLSKVVIAEPMRDYAVRLVLATHPDSEFCPERVKSYVRWGASPRAGQALLLGARVRALAEGRVHISFEDLDYFAAEVLQHRVLLNYDGQAEGIQTKDLIGDVLEYVSPV